MNLFAKSRPPPPAPVPTDKVVPMRFWDNTGVMRSIAMNFTYRFDDVLDEIKLKSALERLFEVGEWRQLGARIRLRTDGHLEHHLPAEYDSERPGFIWSSETFDMRVAEHDVASKLPRATSTPTLFPDTQMFHDLVTREGHPTRIEDWTETDHPPLSVHFVSFQDATLLTLSFSHVWLDAVGRQALLKAWIAVLEGREDDVPPVIPLGIDPSDAIAKSGRTEENLLYKSYLTGLAFFMFVLSIIVEVVLHREVDGRIMCLPGSWVDDLREKAVEDARRESKDPDLFLSHGDVLHAWLSKMTISAQKIRPGRPIALQNVYNIRGLFEDALPSNEAYIGNASFAVQTIMTAGELAESSVGKVALRIRNDLSEQRSARQVGAFVALQKEEMPKTGRSPLGGPWSQVMVSLSNWHKARFFDLIFSAAIVRPGLPLDQRAEKVGQPSLCFPTGHTHGISLRNAGPLIGKDAAGSWWLQWTMRREAWKEFEREFEAMKGGKKEA